MRGRPHNHSSQGSLLPPRSGLPRPRESFEVMPPTPLQLRARPPDASEAPRGGGGLPRPARSGRPRRRRCSARAARRRRRCFVGEQPGDQEDLAGRPFVGPAGRLLDEALELAGIDRAAVYVTNAVKHFKWEARGKRRIHAKPTWSEQTACRPWLEAELAVVAAAGARLPRRDRGAVAPRQAVPRHEGARRAGSSRTSPRT